ncbi:unnamed protein product [Closterium sp. NIES-53]
MPSTIHFIASCLPERLAPVRDTIRLKHPTKLTIDVLESALKDIESNIRSIASASGAVVPPLFQGCTVPQLSTFTPSLASTASPASDETAAVFVAGGRAWGKGGKEGGKGGGVGGGGGGDTGGGRGGGGTGASSGGGIGGGSRPAAPTREGAGVAVWYTVAAAQQQRRAQQQRQA